MDTSLLPYTERNVKNTNFTDNFNNTQKVFEIFEESKKVIISNKSRETLELVLTILKESRRTKYVWKNVKEVRYLLPSKNLKIIHFYCSNRENLKKFHSLRSKLWFHLQSIFILIKLWTILPVRNSPVYITVQGHLIFEISKPMY